MDHSGSSERAALPAFDPELLIAADSDHGRRLLAEAATVDYVPLAQHYQGQHRKNFCSVATSVIALNALRGQAAHSQSAFFTAEVAAIREEAHVDEDGMTLAELAAVLGSHGARVTVHYADEHGPEAFRAMAVENLNRHGDFLLVNYLREALGQRSGGHFSPLAAYHPGTDRFLVLDVADVKYPPVWVETPVLYDAMATIDEHCGRSRGFISVAL
jgi:hypothetical protein